MRLSADVKQRVNRDLFKLETYHDYIPLTEIFNILKRGGVVVLQEDGTLWSGMLTGREGHTQFDVGSDALPVDVDGCDHYDAYTNSSLVLSWYKMESGRYEIVSYLG